MAFNLSKKDPTTRHALKSLGKYVREIVCVVIIALMYNFRSYKLHLCSKVEACSLEIA